MRRAAAPTDAELEDNLEQLTDDLDALLDLIGQKPGARPAAARAANDPSLGIDLPAGEELTAQLSSFARISAPHTSDTLSAGAAAAAVAAAASATAALVGAATTPATQPAAGPAELAAPSSSDAAAEPGAAAPAETAAPPDSESTATAAAVSPLGAFAGVDGASTASSAQASTEPADPSAAAAAAAAQPFGAFAGASGAPTASSAQSAAEPTATSSSADAGSASIDAAVGESGGSKAPTEPSAAKATFLANDEAIQSSGNGQFGLPFVGLRAAPEYGAGMFVANADQISAIVDLKVQKVQASLNALKRYMEELEGELVKKEDQLEDVQLRLQEEEHARLAAEAERDELVAQRAALEAKLVEDTEAEQKAQRQVDDMDLEAELVAARLARGEITEEEAALIEEELIRAEARRLTARETTREDTGELQKVQGAAEDASVRIAEMAGEGERLQADLQRMRDQVAAAQAERDEESRKREEADDRFNKLVERIQAKVGSR